MLISDTDILLNCLASPNIAQNHVGISEYIKLELTNWALLESTENDSETLNDVVLLNFYDKWLPAIQHVGINEMQNLAPNVFDQLFDLAENFIMDAENLVKIDIDDDLLSSDQTYDLLKTVNDSD